MGWCPGCWGRSHGRNSWCLRDVTPSWRSPPHLNTDPSSSTLTESSTPVMTISVTVIGPFIPTNQVLSKYLSNQSGFVRIIEQQRRSNSRSSEIISNSITFKNFWIFNEVKHFQVYLIYSNYLNLLTSMDFWIYFQMPGLPNFKICFYKCARNWFLCKCDVSRVG